MLHFLQNSARLNGLLYTIELCTVSYLHSLATYLIYLFYFHHLFSLSSPLSTSLHSHLPSPSPSSLHSSPPSTPRLPTFHYSLLSTPLSISLYSPLTSLSLSVIEHVNDTASLYSTTVVGNTICLLVKLKVLTIPLQYLLYNISSTISIQHISNIKLTPIIYLL